MNALNTVQELMRDTIAAGIPEQTAYFQDGDVVVDTGSERNAIEKLLNTRGYCVSVDLPIRATVIDRAPGVSQCHALIPVHVQLNPNQISADGGAGKEILDIVDVVCS